MHLPATSEVGGWPCGPVPVVGPQRQQKPRGDGDGDYLAYARSQPGTGTFGASRPAVEAAALPAASQTGDSQQVTVPPSLRSDAAAWTFQPPIASRCRTITTSQHQSVVFCPDNLPSNTASRRDKRRPESGLHPLRKCLAPPGVFA